VSQFITSHDQRQLGCRQFHVEELRKYRLQIGGGGAFASDLENCILYFNSAADGTNYDAYCALSYCCATPQPTNGVGNITNAPLFMDLPGGNLRL
jgi:hypothetical protein